MIGDVLLENTGAEGGSRGIKKIEDPSTETARR